MSNCRRKLCTIMYALTFLGAAQLHAQAQHFNVGDAVDLKIGTQWLSCTIQSPFYGGGYDLKCGSATGYRGSADPARLRPHQNEPQTAAAAPPAATARPAPPAARPNPAPAAPPAAAAGQFRVGDNVEINSAGTWKWCTVSSPLQAGGYNVQCGPDDLRIGSDPGHIRPHTLTAQEQAIVNQTNNAMAHRPTGNGPGAQYGTREPTTCNSRSGPLNATTARQYFICDNEGIIYNTMNLVSNVTISALASRPFNYNQDSAKNGIDVSQPVYDIRGSYKKYQCVKPLNPDNAFNVTHNCYLYDQPNAEGSCYMNTFHEWHCLMSDFHVGNIPVKNQMPPATN